MITLLKSLLTFLSRYCEYICRSSCHGKNPGSCSTSLSWCAILIKAPLVCCYGNILGVLSALRNVVHVSCDKIIIEK